MKRLLLGLLLLCVTAHMPARAQGTSPTVELDLSAGYSTEDTLASATQLRVFGESDSGLRYFLEGAWAAQSGTQSDAFGAGYPYQDGFYWMETYLEKRFRAGGLPGGVRVGRFRTPFGIYGRSEHAYSGFLRAPLIRYADAFALSSYWLEGGAHLVIGKPALQIEASIGAPQEPLLRRREGVDAVVRVQGYHGPVVVGVSYIHTNPFQPAQFAHGRTRFVGVDGRWMRNGLQVRGEWIRGRSFDGVSTEGWYLDGMLHRPWMGAVTGVVRYEELDYAAGPFSFDLQRVTAGARVRFSPDVAGTVNLIHQSHLQGGGDVAVDVGLTYSLRR